MKILKNTLCVVLFVALMAAFVCSCYTSVQQNTSGSYSTTTTVTEESRQWILERFGSYETIPELLAAIDRFGCENFVYEVIPWGLIQSFRMDRFLFRDNMHGVCYDFSCFVKSVVVVWSEFHQREDVQAFVYDVRLRSGAGHSYNFIIEDGHTWFLCLTTNVTRTSKGDQSIGYEEVVGETLEQYMARYREKLMNIR